MKQLIHSNTKVPVHKGDAVKEHSGHVMYISGWNVHSGNLYVVPYIEYPPLHSQVFTPDVYGCEWVEV